MANEQQLAIMFADICDSTALYETFGDARAQATIGRCLSLMTTVTERHGGELIKTIGDEVMAAFGSMDNAVLAAAQIQRDVRDLPALDGHGLQIRVGLHLGPVLRDGGDIFGDAVNVTARIAAQAKAGQILTTAIGVGRLGPVWRDSVRQIDLATVKGKRHEIGIYEVLWLRGDETRIAACGVSQRPWVQSRSLRLEFRGITIELNEARRGLKIGRGDQNDLIVRHSLVSRQHALIDYHKGRFVLTDQSINGTYITAANGTENYVHRDDIALYGHGLIGLGQRVADTSPDAIRYRVSEHF